MPVTEYNKNRHKKNSQWGIHGVHISPGNDKMGHIPSFSTMPLVTCARDVPCGKECYALKLARIRSNVRTCWEANTELVKAGLMNEIGADVDAYLKDHPDVTQFRWNVAGDIYSSAFLAMMICVAHDNPGVTFMAFTKRYNLVPLDGLPDNLKIVLSCWKQYRPSKLLASKYPTAWFDDGTPECGIPANAYHCGGDCEKCLECFTMGPGSAVYFTKH